MMTAVDTNVFVALWNPDDTWNREAERRLNNAFSRGGLAISAPVYAELLGLPGRDETFLDAFLRDNGVLVDWAIGESVWKAAGRAYQRYASQKGTRGRGPRRILADFVIGAHALENGYALLTFDQGIFRAAFPSLKLLS